jgi:hypothetical protein
MIEFPRQGEISFSDQNILIRLICPEDANFKGELAIPTTHVEVSYRIGTDVDGEVLQEVYLSYRREPNNVIKMQIGEVTPDKLASIINFFDLHNYRDLLEIVIL